MYYDDYYNDIALFFGMFAAIFIFVIVILVAAIIINGIPLYKMAKTANIKNPWLAFIPIGNAYIMCTVPSKKFKVFDIWETEDRTQVFIGYLVVSMGGSVLASLLGMIPCIGLLFLLAILAVSYIYLYFVYENIFATYYTDNGTVVMWAILSLFIPPASIIGFYIIMNKPRVDSINNEYKTEINTNYDL